MTAITPVQASPERHRRPLLERITYWLTDHDPGGIDSTRALHLGVALTAVIVIGVATTRIFGLGLEVSFPLMAGTGAQILIAFSPAASRRAEARTMARLFLVGAAFLTLTAAVGPGESVDHAMLQKLLLVPLSFCALILRRYGMDGQRLGLALIVVATVSTILNPTRSEALLLLVAFCQGAAVATALRLSPWRPSATATYVRTTFDMQAAAAAYLRALSEAIRNDVPFDDRTALPLERLRTRVWNALANAIVENPGSRGDFEVLRAKVYRLRVAVRLLANCIPQTTPAGADWRAPFAAATDHIARRLEAITVRDTQAEERFARALAQLRARAFAPDLPAEARFALMRALTAFERLALVVSGIAEIEARPFPPPRPPGNDDLPTPAPLPLMERMADGGRRMSAPLKVACQGLVATSITTGLDFGIHLSHAYWATMTVMFVIGNSMGETYVRVRYRVVGTLIGVFVGILVFLALGEELWLIAGLCMAGLVISIVTQKDRYDVSSAGIGFSVVLGLHIIVGLDAAGMLARIYETIIGAMVALAVSYVVLPVYVTDQLRPEVMGILRRCRDAFASGWPHPGETASVASQVQAVRLLGARLPQFGAEQVFGHSAGDVANIVTTLDVLVTYLALIEDISGRLAHHDGKDQVAVVVEAARARTLGAFAAVLGESAAHDVAVTTPALDAAIATALSLADHPGMQECLPLAADYLAYSEALLRPLNELRNAFEDEAPWQKEHARAANIPE